MYSKDFIENSTYRQVLKYLFLISYFSKKTFFIISLLTAEEMFAFVVTREEMFAFRGKFYQHTTLSSLERTWWLSPWRKEKKFNSGNKAEGELAVN